MTIKAVVLPSAHLATASPTWLTPPGMDWLDWLAEVRVALLVFADFAGSAGS
jgi:hypothetical protein